MPNSNFVSKFDWLTNLRMRADITVRTKELMFELKTYLRKWKMVVGVWDDPDESNNGLYVLKYKKSSDIISDNDNWERLEYSAADCPSGIKNYIREGEILHVKEDYEYNVFRFTVDGEAIIDGELNML